jgi:hypothetical protein
MINLIAYTETEGLLRPSRRSREREQLSCLLPIEAKNTLMLRYLLRVLFLCGITARLIAAPLVAELAGRSVTMSLVKAADLSPVALPGVDFKLTSESVRTTANFNIYTLLQANGIAPDTEAFTIAYDLNPDISDLKSLPAGTRLDLPKVGNESAQQKLLQEGYLFQITVDPLLREDLNQRARILQELSPRFVAVAKSEAARNQISTLAKWYAQIEKSFLRRTGPPMRQETLLQLRNEVSILNSLGTRAVQIQQLSKPDGDQLAAIYQDLEAEMKKYGQVFANQAPKADALHKVLVRIQGDDTKLIERLRIYYTVNGIFRDPPTNPPVTSYAFKELGSGKTVSLPAKNYMIWAARDGDPGHPLTAPLLVQVTPEKTEIVPVDISVRNGSNP